VMTERKFCMQLDNYKELHLTSGKLFAMVIQKLTLYLGKSFVMFSALIMFLLA
jgi:hypothetical protein